MAQWARFYPDLMIHLPDCPVPLVDQELRHASIEFFRKTGAWTTWLDPVTCMHGVTAYDLDIPPKTAVHRINKTTVDGKPINVLSVRMLDTSIEADPNSNLSGVGTTDKKTINLTHAYPAGSVLRVEATLIPSIASDGLPDDFFEQYSGVICSGALARLMLTPATKFFNTSLARVHQANFDAHAARCTLDVWRGSTRAVQRSRPHFC